MWVVVVAVTILVASLAYASYEAISFNVDAKK